MRGGDAWGLSGLLRHHGGFPNVVARVAANYVWKFSCFEISTRHFRYRNTYMPQVPVVFVRFKPKLECVDTF
jgi:hypothetical protein